MTARARGSVVYAQNAVESMHARGGMHARNAVNPAQPAALPRSPTCRTSGRAEGIPYQYNMSHWSNALSSFTHRPNMTHR